MKRWTVEQDVPHERARAVLEQDRIANGYALIDLEPPFAPFTRVALAGQYGADASAALLAVRHPSFTGIVTHGPAEGVAALLAAVTLPDETDFDIKPAHLPAFIRVYEPLSLHERLVMAVAAPAFHPPAAAVAAGRLGMADLPALLDLYAGYPGNIFSATQLESGVFFGIRGGKNLVAAGGTHAVGRRAGLAAVGNIFTRPEVRGRGYGAAITAAITIELFAAGIPDVFLTVNADNAAAIRVYERLGFRTHGRVWEARARRRLAPDNMPCQERRGE